MAVELSDILHMRPDWQEKMDEAHLFYMSNNITISHNLKS